MTRRPSVLLAAIVVAAGFLLLLYDFVEDEVLPETHVEQVPNLEMEAHSLAWALASQLTAPSYRESVHLKIRTPNATSYFPRVADATFPQDLEGDPSGKRQTWSIAEGLELLQGEDLRAARQGAHHFTPNNKQTEAWLHIARWNCRVRSIRILEPKPGSSSPCPGFQLEVRVWYPGSPTVHYTCQAWRTNDGVLVLTE